MTIAPKILAIYIAPKADAAMVAQPSVELTPNGIKGDRYENGSGAYSKTTPSKIRHVSLISEEGIATANEWLSAMNEPVFTALETRRNIVIAHLSANGLNQLVGKTFFLGRALLKGIELCTPCQRPAQLMDKPNFIYAFENRGGLRAEVLSVGPIHVGDTLREHQENP
jgi:MOSC domain-containing protein YiiM